MNQLEIPKTSGGSKDRLYKVTCKHHPDARIHNDSDTGDMVCCQCGLVVGDRLVDDNAEWRNFSSDPSEKDRCRVGAAEDPLFDDGSLYTLVGPATGSAGLDNRGISKYFKHSTEAPAQKALKAVFRDIGDTCTRLQLPLDVANTARGLYKELADKSLTTGCHKDARAMACIYIACRTEKKNRTFKEICDKSGIPNAARRIGKAYKEITNNSGIAEPSNGQEDVIMERLCTSFQLPQDVLPTARFILAKVLDTDYLSRKDCATVCGAVIMLIAAAINKTAFTPLGTVIQLVGCSQNAILTSYKTLRNHAESLFPPDFQFAVPLKNLPRTADLFI